jgi:hypothetical protein
MQHVKRTVDADLLLEYLNAEYNDNNHEEAGNFEAGARFTAMAAINYIQSLLSNEVDDEDRNL